MLVWLIKKILFIIILQPFIIILILFIVTPGFYRNFDYFFKGRSPVALSIEQKFMEAIVVKREFATREIFQNSEFEQYCVFGPEVYPLSEIHKDVNIFHNVGGWGWNDMAFYIRFSRKEFIVLIELPRYIPIEKVEKLCGPNLVIRFSTEGVFVVDLSD